MTVNPHGLLNETYARVIDAWTVFANDPHDIFAQVEVVAACDYVRECYGVDAYLWAVAQGQGIFQAVNA